MQYYHEEDVDMHILDGKRIAVLGYGSQGRAQALCFRDSGLNVVVGVRRNGASWEKVKEDGLKVCEFADAVRDADIVMMLLPDEIQPKVYYDFVEKNMKKGAALEFAHGFAITYGTIVPRDDIDVIMMAPKGPGNGVRKMFLEGYGVPALVSVHQDVSGHARDIVFALAKAIGATHPGAFEQSFKNEAFTDLFGEQAVLCGGLTELIRMGFDTLVEGGYPPEMAYIETLHETKLITDLINKGGFSMMWEEVSNTAEFGGLTRGPRILNEQSREAMRQILREIEDGTFKNEWTADWDDDLAKLKSMEDAQKKLRIETVGKEVRSLFQKRD